ncbi:MAG: SDR family NAD(P)-dependent oxidoreductase [Candidatus Omnitrophica bacterium]|nr:SDR family NAD(P)-dependent oxidoreductase [Candidatus Omnitrophota bacterium]
MNNRVVLITGASSGIGKDTARAFARLGARVVLCARSSDLLDELAGDIRLEGGTAWALPVDVTRREAVIAAVQAVLRQWDRLEVLVNNAGVGYSGELVSMPIEQVQKLVDVNFLGVIHFTQAVLPEMIRQGVGQIINVSSVIGKRATPGHAVYCATKFALNGLTEALRVEVAGHGIRVSLVCPTLTDTPFSEHSGSDGRPRSRPRRPSAMSPAAVAQAIVKTALKGRREVVLSWPAKAMLAMNVICPRLLDWGMAKWWKRH